MLSSDDEKSDEWIESYDSCDTDSEMDDGMPDANVIQKFKLQKRTKFTKDGNGSSVESDENCGNNESETENETNNFKLKSNPAWADAMTKILRSKKTAHKKGIVLSKAKKLSDVKEKKKVELDFEIVGATNQEQSDPDEKEDKKPDTKKKFGLREYQIKGRVKPSILDRDREKTLMKIATKGVVQLFNVVRQQQKSVNKTSKSARKMEIKREKLLENIDKKKFMNVLAGSVSP